MDWGRVTFFLQEVLRSFTRNPIMQLTTIGTVMVTILILGSFSFGKQMLATIGNDVIQKIEISVFLNDDVNASDAHRLQRKIAGDPRVRSVAYISKAQGLELMRARLRGQVDTSLLTSNPLPNALRVKVVDPANVEQVAARIRKLHGVATTEYAADAIAKVLRLSEILARVGSIVVGLLLLTAAIIIGNTIRLTVFARRREISIMQLVGASSGYIRAPFICEGFLHGAVGSVLAIGLLGIAQQQLLPKVQLALPFIPLRITSSDDLTYALTLLAVGATIGIVSSWLAVTRHLKA